MLVLALDTATPAPALALAGGGRDGEERLPEGRTASEALLPALRALLSRSGVRLADVGRIAAFAGPGSFTGIRVSLATAWGLARALQVPLETVDSLEMLAETARAPGVAAASAAIDAGRGEAYVAEFDLSAPRAAALSATRIVSAAEVSRLPAPRVVLPSSAPPATSPALAAARAVLRAPGPDARQPLARYVRTSAAEEFHGIARS